jgi:hypothetical protein
MPFFFGSDRGASRYIPMCSDQCCQRNRNEFPCTFRVVSCLYL